MPPFAGLLLFVRAVIVHVPLWQMVLSLVLQAASVWLAATVSAKIYRVGIFLDGQTPSLRRILTYVRAAS